SAMTELRDTGPPTNTTGGAATWPAQSGNGSRTSSGEGRFSTSPSAPSSLSSSMKMTVRSKFGSPSIGVATSSRPFVDPTGAAMAATVPVYRAGQAPAIALDAVRTLDPARTAPPSLFGGAARSRASARGGATMPHPEVVEEQRHLDHAYRCLEAMRHRAESASAVTDMAAQAVDGEVARWHLNQRLRGLDTDVAALAFGRIDEEGTAGAPGATWYVGRRHVEDGDGEPVVVDWRAPVSTPFYRATASDPFGLRMRRRFLMTGRRVDDLFDEIFDDPDSVHAARHGGIPDPLLAELERERTGEMRDIVATIQAEQDVVIRA